ncbi:hypothetical protein [Nonomuraea typhae]|uniref:hypothetical protein n=1 Tax=Nonomuraea typhae TaxID=2603600 RepID=UPI0012F8B622|nr:hypothetical protein [Nonomuraea typhae]
MQVLGWLHDAALVGAYLLVIVPFLPMLISLLLALRIGEGSQEKLLRRTYGRYIGPDELDTGSRDLLARAQAAVDLVFGSEVHQAGLLDSIHNQVVLPRQEWEIAQALRGLSQLRQRHPDLSIPTGGPDEGALSPAARTFREALETVSDRVRALERYAEQVKAPTLPIACRRRPTAPPPGRLRT